jgi:hypothetical protein
MGSSLPEMKANTGNFIKYSIGFPRWLYNFVTPADPKFGDFLFIYRELAAFFIILERLFKFELHRIVDWFLVRIV